MEYIACVSLGILVAILTLNIALHTQRPKLYAHDVPSSKEFRNGIAQPDEEMARNTRRDERQTDNSRSSISGSN